MNIQVFLIKPSYLSISNNPFGLFFFILEIIRKSASFNDKLAEKGFFIEKLDPKKNILLIRVTLTSDLYYYPQISVGKQRLNIMFMSKDDKNNLLRFQEDVSFILTTCVL